MLLGDRERRYRALRSVGLKTNRLDTLIDGVYAIALTLLVLDLKLPESLAGNGAVNAALSHNGPKLLVYVIAFSSVALSWMSHHYYSSLVIRTDFLHVLLNLTALMLVALVPFSAAAMGTYYQDAWAVATFALNMAAVGLVYVANWHHCRGYLLADDIDRALLRFSTLMAWAFVCSEAVAAAVAFLSPYAGIAVVALTIVTGFVAIGVLEPRIIESRYRANAEAEQQNA